MVTCSTADFRVSIAGHGPLRWRCVPRKHRSFAVRTLVFLTATLTGLIPMLRAEAAETTSSVVWNQVGEDLEGEAEADRSGASIAISEDGTRIVIGATTNDSVGSASGHARVFEWDTALLTWIQLGTDIDGVAGGDESGAAVAISENGNRVAIGSPYHDGPANSTGHVRVFEYDGNDWIQVGGDIEGGTLADWLGWSVAMSSDGNRIAVGAPQTYGGGSRYGFVRVLDWDLATSDWVQVGSEVVAEAEGDRAGFALGISADGTRLAIGAPANDGVAGTNRGHVRVFEWDDVGSDWDQLGADIDGDADYDFFGEAVSMSSDGELVVIGAPNNDAGGTSAGEASVYRWDSAATAWVQVGASISGAGQSAEAGSSVAIAADGGRVAIGSTGDSMSGTGDAVQVYDWDENQSAWIQAGLTFTGRGNGDVFGASTALGRNGGIVAIGAPSAGWGENTEGYVRLFESLASLAFDLDGGVGGPGTVTGGGGASVTVSNTEPTRDGYTFTGWNTAADGSGTRYAGDDSYTLPNSGTDTLYAQWEPVTTTTTTTTTASPTTTTTVAPTTTTTAPPTTTTTTTAPPTTTTTAPPAVAPPTAGPAEPVTGSPTFTG